MKEAKHCGAQGTWIVKVVPELIFGSACELHDTLYSSAKSKEDYKKADRIFLKRMLDLSKKRAGLERAFYTCVSYVYFIAVSVFGIFFQKNRR